MWNECEVEFEFRAIDYKWEWRASVKNTWLSEEYVQEGEEHVA